MANNFLNILNEGVVLFLTYYVLLFTNFVPDFELKYTFGFGFLGVVGLAAMINIVLQFVLITKDLVKAFINWRRRR